MAKTSDANKQPAYDYLLQMILTKQLMPGTRISEAKVAEEFNMSRTPVRDAMRRLANDGLIDIYPNRFAQIAVYTPTMIQEVGMMRLSLDQLAVRLSLIFGSKADFFELEKIADNCLEANRQNDMMQQHRFDCDFHLHLAEISRNALLIKFQKELYTRALFLLVNYPDDLGGKLYHPEQHLQITKALIAQDKETALQLVTQHIVTFYRLSDRVLNDFL